jgi:hypothetical protein
MNISQIKDKPMIVSYDVNFDKKRDILAEFIRSNVTSLTEEEAQQAARLSLLYVQALAAYGEDYDPNRRA